MIGVLKDQERGSGTVPTHKALARPSMLGDDLPEPREVLGIRLALLLPKRHYFRRVVTVLTKRFLYQHASGLIGLA
ncbi:MAG: hypothetical protein OXP28_08955 [Gammaproteobacteria bacterium]|nr:hypothetical protein [Gammaproteobacteria bacterium]